MLKNANGMSSKGKAMRYMTVGSLHADLATSPGRAPVLHSKFTAIAAPRNVWSEIRPLSSA